MVGDLENQIYEHAQISALEEDQNMIQMFFKRSSFTGLWKEKGRINEQMTWRPWLESKHLEKDLSYADLMEIDQERKILETDSQIQRPLDWKSDNTFAGITETTGSIRKFIHGFGWSFSIVGWKGSIFKF